MWSAMEWSPPRSFLINPPESTTRYSALIGIVIVSARKKYHFLFEGSMSESGVGGLLVPLFSW